LLTMAWGCRGRACPLSQFDVTGVSAEKKTPTGQLGRSTAERASSGGGLKPTWPRPNSVLAPNFDDPTRAIQGRLQSLHHIEARAVLGLDDLNGRLAGFELERPIVLSGVDALVHRENLVGTFKELDADLA